MSEALYYLVATLAVWALAACLERPDARAPGCLLGAVGARVRDAAAGGRTRRDDPARARASSPLAERSLAPVPSTRSRRSRCSEPARRLWVVGRRARRWVRRAAGRVRDPVEADEYSLGDIAQSLAWQTGAVALLTVAVPLVALGILAWECCAGARRTAPRPCARRRGARVRRRHARRRRRVRVALRRARHRAPAPLRRAADLRGLRGVAAPRLPQTAAGDLDRGVRGRRSRAPPPARPRDHAGRVRRRAVDDLARAAQRGISTSRRSRAVYAGALALLLLAAVLLPRRACPLLAVARRARAGGGIARRLARDSRPLADRARAHLRRCARRLDRRERRAVTWRCWSRRALLADRPGSCCSGTSRSRASSRLRGPSRPASFRRRSRPCAETACSRLTREATSRPRAVAAPTGTSMRRRGARVAPRVVRAGRAWSCGASSRRFACPAGSSASGRTAISTARKLRGSRCSAAGPGELQLTLLGKQGLPTRIRSRGTTLAERAIPPGAVWRVAVPAPESADGTGRCVYVLETDGLVGSTRIEFVRSS